MKRRKFIALLGFAAATWPLVAHAQQPKKIPHLCFLTFDPGTSQSRSPRFDVFFNSLRDLGYVDGQTIVIDYIYPLMRRTIDFRLLFQSVCDSGRILLP